MSLLKPLTPLDVLFVCSVACFAGGTLLGRHRFDSVTHPVVAVGWIGFAAFWTVNGEAYLADDRVFLGSVSGVTALLSAYTATLALRKKAPYRRLTTAFAIMGLLFVPYQFLLPLFHGVLRLVTAHTVWGLSVLGFAPTIEVGVTGQPTALRFSAAPYIRYNIISACTGISAITLFAGLIGAADAPPKRRAGVALATCGFVYCMNILRTVIVGGAIGGTWFAATGSLTTALFGVERPALVSFYFAEYLLVQLLVVLALLGVYAVVVRRLPSVQRLSDDLSTAINDDRTAVRRRLTQR